MPTLRQGLPSQAIYNDGIPAAMFYVDNIDEQYEILNKAGVQFNSAPTSMGNVKIVVFDDTCGNYICLCEK